MSTPQPPESPRIGVDEWVSSAEGRRERGRAGRIEDAFARVPPVAKLAALALPFALYPFLVDSDYLMQVGIDTLIFVLLALGLNVAVGWVGLLDLGSSCSSASAPPVRRVASGTQGGTGPFAIPLIAVVVAVVGFLVGLPSRRLVGDYLAIVTLFFLQLWLVILVNASFTRGPNGISDIYPLEFFGRQVTSLDGYFYVALIAFVLIVSFLYLLNQSRTGRAWRAVREDELASELMTMPVNRLKLMAFAVGAGVAGIAGAIFAPVQGAVFPASFDIVLLITVYAMVVLGGAGSLFGVTAGRSSSTRRSRRCGRGQRELALLQRHRDRALLLVRPRCLPVAILAGTVASAWWCTRSPSSSGRRSSRATVRRTRIDELAEHWVLLPEGAIRPDGLPAGAFARLAYLGLSRPCSRSRSFAAVSGARSASSPSSTSQPASGRTSSSHSRRSHGSS
jgi:ABC-type branched-subunit amino acid transport system permease subunit